MRAKRPHRPSGAADVVKAALAAWSADRSPQIAAALAYYTLFSIAPLLLLAAQVAGFFYGRSGGAHFLSLARAFVGARVTLVLRQILLAGSRHRAGQAATLFGTVTLLVGASGAFACVQSGLDQVWGVRPKPGRGVKGVVADRLPTFLLLGVVGALFAVSLLATALISRLHAAVPAVGAVGQLLAESANAALVIALMTVLFALVFRVLPDAEIAWRDVWLGALVTAVLSAVGQALIAAYLSMATVGTAFGAAGSLIAVLVWLYYSGLVFLLGAEFTKVIATRRGSEIRPSPDAQAVRVAVADERTP